MAAEANRKTFAKRMFDRLFRRPAGRFRHTLAGHERTLLVRMDVINRCNLRCFMCPYLGVIESGGPPDIMSLQLFERISDQVFRHAYHLALSCAYEPLMHPNIGEILEIASRYEVPEWGMVTNGSLLDERIARAMIRHQATSVSISIDAASAERYQAIRGRDMFDRVVANVRALQKMKKEMGSELPHLLTNFVLMRRNVDEILPYLRLCRELEVEDVTFVHVMPRSRENEESLINEPERYEEVYREARRFADENGMRVVLPAPFTPAELAGEAERRLQQSRSDDLRAGGAQTTSLEVKGAGDDIYCVSPWMMLFISPTGDVHPCSHRQYDPPFGNLARQSFEEIWNGPAFLQLRRQLYYHELEGRCRSCQAATPNSEPMVRRPIRIF